MTAGALSLCLAGLQQASFYSNPWNRGQTLCGQRLHSPPTLNNYTSGHVYVQVWDMNIIIVEGLCGKGAGDWLPTASVVSLVHTDYINIDW